MRPSRPTEKFKTKGQQRRRGRRGGRGQDGQQHGQQGQHTGQGGRRQGGRRRGAPPGQRPHAERQPVQRQPHARTEDEAPAAPAHAADLASVEGVLELGPKGFGFLRSPARNYAAQQNDPYVGNALVSRFHLRPGLLVRGKVEPARGGTGPRLVTVESIEGLTPARYHPRAFDELTPIDPHDWIRLETGPEPLTTRVMDLLTPIGRGQRGLIVAPPRSGKTILLQHIALAVAKNYPDMHIVMLLIDERPEEVTEMRRTVKGEVVASSSDRETAEHVRLAELVVERAKRLAELGQDVFLLLDSLTRLARAYNKAAGSSGRTLSGGIDIRALETPKRLFGTARVFEEGGSLTVLGTALIETGSRMDEVIFQEFKGTGNMELVLDRRLAERRIFPAIDVGQSGTRKEERLLPAEMLKKINLLRRSMASLNPIPAMDTLTRKMADYENNAAFLERIGTFLR
jgi:transcription termination factor Rho